MLTMISSDILTRLPTLFPPTPSDQMNDTLFMAASQAPARHLAKYIFPRQFELHNVFTSPKPRTSLEVLPDYLDRELEIKVGGLLSLVWLALTL